MPKSKSQKRREAIMKPRSGKMTIAKIEKIKVLKKKGLTERAIAKAVGCCRSTVWYWLQK